MNKIFKIILLFVILSSLSVFADELSILEKAIHMADNRLKQGFFLTNIVTDKDFTEQASRQVEFALISLKSQNIFTEDMYNLSLYCLSRKHKRYALAISVLKQAYEVEEYNKLKIWLKKRISILENKDFIEDNFDINKEIADLRKNVLRY